MILEIPCGVGSHSDRLLGLTELLWGSVDKLGAYPCGVCQVMIEEPSQESESQ